MTNGDIGLELIHTLLFLLRENALQEDLDRSEKCLTSLEKSTYKKVIVFNQGFWDNEHVKDYLKQFRLECIVIGDGINKGIVIGRQSCFEHIWQGFTETKFISELHLDMIFTFHWEDALVDYLNTHDEPLISCGIVDKNGTMAFLNSEAQTKPSSEDCMDDYLAQLKQDAIVYGFTHPCVHKSDVLKEVGGYDTHFLKGKQAFEDDSLLLGYHYYYGTRANWRPKVNYQSVVYHEVAGQRFGINDSMLLNYRGLVRQYGAMGLKRLALLHQSIWHIQYFAKQFHVWKNME